MFFLASKILWLFIEPVNLLLFGALVGVFVVRWRPVGARRVALFCLGALLFLGIAPIGNLLIRPLEQRFPAPAADAPAPYGIIILGGAIDDEASLARGQTKLADGAARLTEGAILARRYPSARIIYTSGSSSISGKTSTEAAEARKLLIALGVDPARIEIETRSRNTDENARFTAALVHPTPEQRWFLVTSAYHIPRSMGLFQKAGFNVVAYPVDYQTLGDGRDWRLGRDPVHGLERLDLAVHEWTGLTAYYAAGKIDTWFPGP